MLDKKQMYTRAEVIELLATVLEDYESSKLYDGFEEWLNDQGKN